MEEIKEAIAKVLTESKSRGGLKKIGMPEGEPLSSFKLSYDSQTSQLESIYYWLLDLIQERGIEVEKVTDNFTASPGSGQFAEMGARVTRMQEQGMKILGLANQVIKTILNLVYDLKEFEIRLEHYEDAKSDNPEKKEAGNLSLKQIWLDNVDLKRGKGSIHQMAYEMGFTTIREGFMISNSVADIKKNEILNEQVKRILIPRISEFLKWKDYSEKELRKRFHIEKTYLKTEVESLKLYTSWVRPYLKAAEQLRQKGFEKNPALVNAFSTSMFDLVLLGKQKIDFTKAVQAKELPEGFANYKMKRDYYACVVVSFLYRGHVSQRVTQKGDQGFAMGGRVDMTFDSYALNEQELELVEKEMAKMDIENGLKFVYESTDTSLEELKEDLDHFLSDDKQKEEKEKQEKEKENINPFSALFGLFKPSFKKAKKVSETKDLKRDNFIEKAVREVASKKAKDALYSLYDIYKKAHGMASSFEEFSY